MPLLHSLLQCGNWAFPRLIPAAICAIFPVACLGQPAPPSRKLTNASTQAMNALSSKPLPAPTLPAEAEAVLPAELRHVFAPINKDWIVQTAYLKPQSPDPALSGYIVVEVRNAGPDTKGYAREISYFASRRDKDSNNFRKYLVYRPDGTLTSESDRSADGKEQFDRAFYRDGSLASFAHYKDNHNLAGYSVSPDKKRRSYFVNGNGDWIEWQNGSGSYTHTWFYEGSVYLGRIYANDVRVRTDLYLRPGNDALRITGNKEMLSWHGQFWNREAGKVSYQDDHFGEWSHKPPTPQQVQQHQAELAARYTALRTEFAQQYAALLTKAGKTPASLGISKLLAAPVK